MPESFQSFCNAPPPALPALEDGSSSLWAFACLLKTHHSTAVSGFFLAFSCVDFSVASPACCCLLGDQIER